MLRVFAPPEDRVRDIFNGSQTNLAQERKMRELEKKKAYAAELQAQMREREQQRQMDRMQRLGAGPGAQSRVSQLMDSTPPATFAVPQHPLHPDDTSPTAANNMANWPLAPLSYQSSPPANGTSMQQPTSAACYQPNGSPYTVSYATAEPYGAVYPQQAGYVPGGWPSDVMQPPSVQLFPYPGNPAAAYATGYSVPGRQGQMAMPAAAQADPYNTLGKYGPAARVAAGNSALPPWAQPPANFAPSSMVSPAGGYAPESSMCRPPPVATAGTGIMGSPPWGAAATSTAMPEANPAAAAAKSRKDAYRAELEAQIKDKAARKAAEKNAIAAEEARREAEAAGYNPWGKAGAGAPLRDESGLVVCNIRGRPAVQQQTQSQQQQQLYQQQQAMRHQPMYQQAVDSSDQAAYSPPVDMSGYWGAAGDTAPEQQQQLQQPGPAGTTMKSAAAPSSTPGPPPLLNFRSDKAFMTADEVEKRQRAQLELQKELDQQIQEKKRRKELEQKQAEEEARREDERLAAEQARLAAQFEQEQNKERAKANKTADVEEQVAGAWNAAKATAAKERRKTIEERRRSQGQVDNDTPVSRPQQQSLQRGQSSFQAIDQQQFYSSFHAVDNQQQQQAYRSQAGGRAAAQDALQQLQIPQQQERQQMMLEALQLEEEKMRQVAAQELQRLRAEMEAQTASLRDVVERQGGEVAALRAAAATAEAESLAAKSELMQVRQDMLRRSQEMQHETLNTILADYGNGPVSRITAAYHPTPIRRVELDMPPPAASVRRSVQLPRAAAEEECALDAFAVGGAQAVDLTSSIWQQSKQPVEDLSALYQSNGIGAAVGVAGHHRRASVPAAPPAAAHSSANITHGWISAVHANQADNVRSSLLVSESTFIFPTGVAADGSPSAAADGGDDQAAAGAAGCLDGIDSTAVGAAAGVYGSSSALEIGSHWGLWQKQQPGLQRHTLSAPGSSHAADSTAGPLASSSRKALVTPGGSDLTSVMDRNANRLQLLDGMSAAGTSEELDDFLAKFVSESSQPNQRNIATPPSRLLSAHGRSHQQQQQQHTVQLLQQPPDRKVPSRYGFSADAGVDITGARPSGVQGATALAHAAEAASSSLYLGIADTLEQELSRMGLGDSYYAGLGTSAAAESAQQRLLAAGME